MEPKNTKLGLYVLLSLGLVIALSSLFSNKTASFTQKKSQNSNDVPPLTSQNKQLGELIQKNLPGDSGEYSVFIESLSQDQPPQDTQSANVLGAVFKKSKLKPLGYEYNSTKVFPSASLYKLVLLAAALKQIQTGQLSADTPLSAGKDYLTDRFGSVDFGYEDADDQINYSVDEAMTRVATISDNFAAIMLTDELIKVAGKSDPLTQMAHELGMEQTTLNKDELTTTARDVGIFFEHLYRGEVVSKDASDKIISLLERSQINDRIPDQLPDEVQVAHKTGELPGVRHDAGIVFLDKNPYLIVLMSQDLTDENEGIQTLSGLSKEVFDFFKTLPNPTPTGQSK